MLKSILKELKFTPLHLLLWIGVWLFYTYFFSYGSNNERFVFWFSTSLLPVTISITYFVSYILIPKYLITKKYVKFGIYLFYTLICSVYLILIITFINLVFLSNFDIREMPLLSRNVVFVLILVYLVVSVVCFVQLLRYNHKTANRNQELENKLLEGKLVLKQKELYLLKQQIHPHFLFNTLNTLYGFALKGSEETPDLILKLSNLLDYILNQIDKPKVPLSEEVKHIESYIGLERVRFRDSLRVEFTKDIHKEISIPPMLFIAFVENAFKHGTAIDGLLVINMSLKTTTNQLLFAIQNTIHPDKISAESHGIGIENTRKRLESIFPNQYTLTQSKNETHYTVQLEIQLHS
ncbi:sensor histidine kinase [uncultured Dokdonia sp.]|uniref:sensor histidine kinase n=1 Tax=uncultured Dokdonia sp. TaxID=575653 RepID=UPI00262296BE|nr:sensor histidine kinase [uncultured Dokdonia sp.]